MNILYKGGYSKRFAKVVQLLKEEDKNILELCFGDIIVAQYCRNHDKKWCGIDFNESFVSFAQRKGFNAQLKDIFTLNDLQDSDVCIMIGSLYHFSNDVNKVLSLMNKASSKIIISEPISNLSNRDDLLGLLSRKCTNSGKGNESFRFTEDSFLKILNNFASGHHLKLSILNRNQRDICVVLEK